MDMWPTDSSGMVAEDGFLLHDTAPKHAHDAHALRPHSALASKQRTAPYPAKPGAMQPSYRGQTPFSFISDASPNSGGMDTTPPTMMEQLSGSSQPPRHDIAAAAQPQQQSTEDSLALPNMPQVTTRPASVHSLHMLHRTRSSQSPGPAYGSPHTSSSNAVAAGSSPRGPAPIGSYETGVAQDQQLISTDLLHSNGPCGMGPSNVQPAVVPPSPGATQEQADSWNLFAKRLRTGSLQRLASAKLRPTLSQVESVGRMSWEEHTSVMDDAAPLADLSDTLLLYDMWGSTPASPLARPPSSSQLLLRSTLTSSLPKLHPLQGGEFMMPGSSLPHCSSISPCIMASQEHLRESYSGGNTTYPASQRNQPPHMTSPYRSAQQLSSSLRGPLSGRTTWSPATATSSIPQPGSGASTIMRSGSLGMPPGQRSTQVLTVRPWYGGGAPFSSTGELTDSAGDGATYSPGHLLSSPMHRLLSLDTAGAPHSAHTVESHIVEWPDLGLKGMKPSGSEGALDLLLQDDTRELYHQAHSRRSMEQVSGDGREGMSSGTDVVSLLEEAESAHRVALGAALDVGPQSVGTLLLRPSHEVQQATFQQAASQREHRGVSEWLSNPPCDMPAVMPADDAAVMGAALTATDGRRPASAMASKASTRPASLARHVIPQRTTYHGQTYQDIAPAGATGHMGLGLARRGFVGAAGRYSTGGGGSPRAGVTMAGVHSPVKLNRRGAGMFSRMRHVCSTPALDVLVESQQEGVGALTEPSHIVEYTKEGARMPSVADLPDEEHAGAGPGAVEGEGVERPMSSHGGQFSGSYTSVATTAGSTKPSSHAHSAQQPHGLGDLLAGPSKASLSTLLAGRMSTPGRIEGLQQFSTGTWDGGEVEDELDFEAGGAGSLAEMLAAVGEVKTQRQLTMPPARSPITTRLSYEAAPAHK